MKRIVTVQDISCIGKCSLTVALPILSAMKIETAILPTAVLSTHTMFNDVSFHDLTDEIPNILKKWENEGFAFNAIYTGYLASQKQIEIAKQLIHDAKNKPLIIIDPCMADNGKLYTGFDTFFVDAMKDYCKFADIITPNITEACLLTNTTYTISYDEAFIQDLLKKLICLGCKKAIITGVTFQKGYNGAYGYDSIDQTFHSYFNEAEKENFHGTGDIWASVLTGSLVNGDSLDEAIKLACDFVKESIHLTLEEENHNVYGVNFEEALPILIKR